MIRLTPGQAETYEYIKKGECSIKEIQESTKRSLHTIDGQITQLIRYGMVKKVKKGRFTRLIAAAIPYEVIEYNFQPKQTKLSPPNTEKFVQLDNEKIAYLKNHLGEKRSKLAKKLEITKAQLFYELSRFG